MQKFGAVLGAVCGCKANKQGLRWCGYIYQANAWYGGWRVFEIEFQFQLVLSLVFGVVWVLSKDKVRVPSR